MIVPGGAVTFTGRSRLLAFGICGSCVTMYAVIA